MFWKKKPAPAPVPVEPLPEHIEAEVGIAKGGAEAFMSSLNDDLEARKAVSVARYRASLEKYVALMTGLLEEAKSDAGVIEAVKEHRASCNGCGHEDVDWAFGHVTSCIIQSLAKIAPKSIHETPMACRQSTSELAQAFMNCLLVYGGHVPPNERAVI